jgi:hypothetical protein
MTYRWVRSLVHIVGQFKDRSSAALAAIQICRKLGPNISFQRTAVHVKLLLAILNRLRTKLSLSYLKTQFVLRSKHSLLRL